MIRVRVVRVWGSTPREAGAEMFVARDDVEGTIGGGQLEYLAIDRARRMIAQGEREAALTVALGPDIGQCCGGKVELAFDRERPARREAGPPVMVFGAGHVGRALARALKSLPLASRLIDTRAAELALADPDIPTTLSASRHENQGKPVAEDSPAWCDVRAIRVTLSVSKRMGHSLIL